MVRLRKPIKALSFNGRHLPLEFNIVGIRLVPVGRWATNVYQLVCDDNRMRTEALLVTAQNHKLIARIAWLDKEHDRLRAEMYKTQDKLKYVDVVDVHNRARAENSKRKSNRDD